MSLNKTPIEWVKNPDGTQGYTWNPITGCLNNCPYCYARKLANTRLKERYLANLNLAPWGQFAEDLRGDIPPDKFGYGNPFYPRFWEDRFYKMPMDGKPKGIFVCDMSDLFGIGIPEEWTKKVLLRIEMSEQHRFYLLTKQPQNLIKFSPFPDNCWVGVTATGYTPNYQALYNLGKVKASVKYISYEPLLGSVLVLPEDLKTYGISWVIIGAQTKPYKPPKIEWVQEIVEACDKAGIKVFLKDNLKPLLEKDNTFYRLIPKSRNDVSMEYIRTLRQEMPE